MSDALLDALEDLLRASLSSWSIGEELQLARSDNQIKIRSSSGIAVSVSRAPASMPFRWVVVVDDRKRTAASVVGVLRIVRQALAPGYQPYHLTLSPLPGHPA